MKAKCRYCGAEFDLPDFLPGDRPEEWVEVLQAHSFGRCMK